ncbi:uncharacterized protein LOC8062543 [Sorghum bicolor]|uniref:uncharacterized protein LOC8062543 n=1 Tax=Sorghum bicolor TaxID=4558 RepID=UPI000B426A48|nr:uncharacterized protein LOC8062543 [Sorghum bicolor]|eukprot:XP_021310224.1 uncharacterized protein LOC8062543 [Sorghum bicolor]
MPSSGSTSASPPSNGQTMADRICWMYLGNRTSLQFVNGLQSFVTAAQTDMSNGHKSSVWCPCIDCKNEKQFLDLDVINEHLIIRGFMDDYTCWNKHGEEGVNHRDQVQAAGQQYGEDGLHETDIGRDDEEAPFDNQELCDDDVTDIAVSFDEDQLAENL